MNLKKFIIGAIIIGVLFVLGPIVAAQIAGGAFDWLWTFFRELAARWGEGGEGA